MWELASVGCDQIWPAILHPTDPERVSGCDSTVIGLVVVNACSGAVKRPQRASAPPVEASMGLMFCSR